MLSRLQIFGMLCLCQEKKSLETGSELLLLFVFILFFSLVAAIIQHWPINLASISYFWYSVSSVYQLVGEDPQEVMHISKFH